MKQDLANEMRDAGFPEMTRIAAELNLHRYRPLNDMQAASHPFLQEIIAEIPNLILVHNSYSKSWVAVKYTMGVWFEEKKYSTTESNIASGHAGKNYFSGYIDESFLDAAQGETPDEAAGKFWLLLKKMNRT